MLDYIESCMLPLAIIFLLLGFVFLIKGADVFVDGSSSIARKYKVPSIIIGLTIVAMGTSFPELAVSVSAALAHENSLAISNVIGSNLFNTMMVIGCCSLLTPVAVQEVVIKRDLPFSILCAVLLLCLGGFGMQLGHLDGLLFLVIFVAYILFLVRSAMKSTSVDPEDEVREPSEEISLWKNMIKIVIGALCIVAGGEVVVSSATNIAGTLGMSQTLIGLTIVSVGTSLPELVTSIVAARKGEVDMALGNAIGSSTFNVLLILGAASAISPLAFITENIVDIIVLLVFSVIVWIFGWTKRQIGKKEGIIMVLLYIAYVVFACVR